VFFVEELRVHSTLKEDDRRDYEIYKELKRLYKLELERADRLNDKAIALVSSSGVISALYVGLGTFALGRITRENNGYPFLVFFLMLAMIFLLYPSSQVSQLIHYLHT